MQKVFQVLVVKKIKFILQNGGSTREEERFSNVLLETLKILQFSQKKNIFTFPLVTRKDVKSSSQKKKKTNKQTQNHQIRS